MENPPPERWSVGKGGDRAEARPRFANPLREMVVRPGGRLKTFVTRKRVYPLDREDSGNH